MANQTVTILLAGIGGQGTVLASDLLAYAAMNSGYEVKVSEIHGMAQRSGSVTSSVCFGEKVSTMIASPGTADILISFETTEALRNLSALKQGGVLVVSDVTFKPVTVLQGQAQMPKNPQEQIKELGGYVVPAVDLATQAGAAKGSNVVLLGFLSNYLPFSKEIWIDAVSKRVPQKHIEANLRCFELGRSFVQS